MSCFAISWRVEGVSEFILWVVGSEKIHVIDESHGNGFFHVFHFWEQGAVL